MLMLNFFLIIYNRVDKFQEFYETAHIWVSVIIGQLQGHNQSNLYQDNNLWKYKSYYVPKWKNGIQTITGKEPSVNCNLFI